MKLSVGLCALVLVLSGAPLGAARAQMGGGDPGNSGENDFAVRAELQNPRFVEPGSPYGYDRSYSRGPAPWPAPPAYEAVPPAHDPYRAPRARQPYR